MRADGAARRPYHALLHYSVTPLLHRFPSPLHFRHITRKGLFLRTFSNMIRASRSLAVLPPAVWRFESDFAQQTTGSVPKQLRYTVMGCFRTIPRRIPLT